MSELWQKLSQMAEKEREGIIRILLKSNNYKNYELGKYLDDK